VFGDSDLMVFNGLTFQAQGKEVSLVAEMMPTGEIRNAKSDFQVRHRIFGQAID